MKRQIQKFPRKNSEFFFENSFEKLKELPVYEGEYNSIQWVKISSYRNLTIFPDKFEGKNFNQGETGLCFLFSSLSSIATIPSLIY